MNIAGIFPHQHQAPRKSRLCDAVIMRVNRCPPPRDLQAQTREDTQLCLTTALLSTTRPLRVNPPPAIRPPPAQPTGAGERAPCLAHSRCLATTSRHRAGGNHSAANPKPQFPCLFNGAGNPRLIGLLQGIPGVTCVRIWRSLHKMKTKIDQKHIPERSYS